MTTYCQDCGRALPAREDRCPHCGKEPEKAAGREADSLSEPRPSGKGFQYWITNVYWYHYRLHTVVAAFIIAVVWFSVHSAVTNVNPDFVFYIMSEQPVFDSQGQELAAFFTEQVEEAAHLGYNILYMDETSEYAMVNWQLYTIGLISDEHSLFIIGESLTGPLADDLSVFHTAEELGFSAGPLPAAIPLSGIEMMEDLFFIYEPMYAMVKRPPRQRDGSVRTEDLERRDLAVACLQALLGA